MFHLMKFGSLQSFGALGGLLKEGGIHFSLVYKIIRAHFWMLTFTLKGQRKERLGMYEVKCFVISLEF